MINASLEKALYYVTGNGNFQNITVEELEKMANEYPYFGVTNLLLAAKMKMDQHSDFANQIQKTAIYFPNINWLHYQLANDSLRQPIVHYKENVEAHETPDINKEVEEPIEIEVQDENLIQSTPQAEEKAIALDNAEAIIPAETELEISDPKIEEIPEQEIQVDTTTNPISLLNDEEDQEEIELTEYNQGFNKVEDEVTQQEEEMATMLHEPAQEMDAFLEEAENELLRSETDGKENSEESYKEPEVLDEHETMFRNIKAMLEASAEEAGSDIENVPILIDPYHTIDYFASQGIRLDLENNPQDKLGKQLKKFTHWLRHMKKLGPEDALEEINKSNDEEEIQNFANSSNTAKEVVTEAMALVLEKQGKFEKAIQLYEKLSFLNNDKSAYFADKIKNLKDI